jgi:hypothetical protein
MIRAALALPPMSRTWAKAREGLAASRPMIYICMVLAAALIGYGLEIRTRGIFACPAAGYASDRYLAYCNGAHYGDYEHGAFYFDLEPSVQHFVRRADVLFLGNSRLQVAFSAAATADWFAAQSARYYLMGFGSFENEDFAERLLRAIRPRARVYVINLDNFFDPSETPPAKVVEHDPGARTRYEEKRLWQRVHEPACQAFSRLCGNKFAIFRSRETGTYYTEGVEPWLKSTPVSYDWSVDQKVVTRNTVIAADFLSHFTQGKCVILTTVPFVGTKIGNANAIAARLDMQVVTPGILDGLQTFDGYHLDHPSAQRWSRAFFQAAGSRIRSCLEKQGASSP